VNVLLQLVRCFDDADIIHVEKTVDPVRDIDIINNELILSDIEQLERMREKRVQ
jgi:ribosome-binding ATPase YchF (GTP1/OBG family)